MLTALAVFFRLVDAEKMLDVYNMFAEMRRQRRGLIETEDQYRLVYSLINRHILTGDNTRYSTAAAIASAT